MYVLPLTVIFYFYYNTCTIHEPPYNFRLLTASNAALAAFNVYLLSSQAIFSLNISMAMSSLEILLSQWHPFSFPVLQATVTAWAMPALIMACTKAPSRVAEVYKEKKWNNLIRVIAYWDPFVIINQRSSQTNDPTQFLRWNTIQLLFWLNMQQIRSVGMGGNWLEIFFHVIILGKLNRKVHKDRWYTLSAIFLINLYKVCTYM